jgi:hypothetical protein
LGKDFELIGSLARWYIERIYGADGTIISSSKFKAAIFPLAGFIFAYHFFIIR